MRPQFKFSKGGKAKTCQGAFYKGGDPEQFDIVFSGCAPLFSQCIGNQFIQDPALVICQILVIKGLFKIDGFFVPMSFGISVTMIPRLNLSPPTLFLIWFMTFLSFCPLGYSQIPAGGWH